MLNLLDCLFGAVVVVVMFSFGVVLGVIPEPYQGQPSTAAPARALAAVTPKASVSMQYPEVFKDFREGFIPEFQESFRMSCGKLASSSMAEEACRTSFDVMVDHHFGEFSKEKLDAVMRDQTHEEWVGFTITTPALKRKLEAALMPIIIRRMANKTLYE